MDEVNYVDFLSRANTHTHMSSLLRPCAVIVRHPRASACTLLLAACETVCRLVMSRTPSPLARSETVDGASARRMRTRRVEQRSAKL